MKTIKRCPSRIGVRVKQDIFLGYVPKPKGVVPLAESPEESTLKPRTPEGGKGAPGTWADPFAPQWGFSDDGGLVARPFDDLEPAGPKGSNYGQKGMASKSLHGHLAKWPEQGKPAGPKDGMKGHGKAYSKGFEGKEKGLKGKDGKKGRVAKGGKPTARPLVPDAALEGHSAVDIATSVIDILHFAQADPAQEALANDFVTELEGIVRRHREQQSRNIHVLNDALTQDISAMSVPIPPHFGPADFRPADAWASWFGPGMRAPECDQGKG
jgi:hypothetical protein